MGLSSSEPGVDEHLFLCEMLGHDAQYDQLNLPDLALGEAVSRRLNCGRSATLRSNARRWLSVFLRGMPRSDTSCWAVLDQKEARWSPELEKWVASQLAE